MRWNRPRSEDGTLSDVNMTPLIDVSLVLVVILLLATPLAFESAFGLRQAAASARQQAEDRDVTRVEMEIVSDQEVLVNSQAVGMADLGPTLRPLLAGGSPPQVTVTCADAVTHGIFVEVLDVTKANGARDIAVIGR
jgi:biopolymer transport protein TolR